jgi:hypothetical protein
MALDGTYSGLLDSIASWLARDDLTDQIPDFVTMFEAVANRRLRVREMETDATLTQSSGQVTLPADFLSARRVSVLSSPTVTLESVAPDWFYSAYPDSTAGTPQVYMIAGSVMRIRPVTTTDVNLAYYAKIPALSGEVNWLFTAHPDLYLFGSLCEAKAFIEDEKRALLWKTRRDGAFDEIERLSNKSRMGSMRPFGPIV